MASLIGALKLAVKTRVDLFANIFGVCIKKRIFPAQCKKQKLVLLSNPKKPKRSNIISSYLPIEYNGEDDAEAFTTGYYQPPKLQWLAEAQNSHSARYGISCCQMSNIMQCLLQKSNQYLLQKSTQRMWRSRNGDSESSKVLNKKTPAQLGG